MSRHPCNPVAGTGRRFRLEFPPPKVLHRTLRRCGRPQMAEDHVFDLPSLTMINVLLKPWAKAAGIDKRFSFHVARHTFATMMLTLGADLYTTSKLLGHADVKMTQVYVKIINQKKDDAVNLVNGLFD